MNRILLITEKESDFSNLLQKSCDGVTVMTPDVRFFDIDAYDALCVLGGNTDDGIVLNAPLRVCVEKFRAMGKPIFCEFVQSISSAYIAGVVHTTHHRMAFDGRDFSVEGLTAGDVLDGHENDCIKFVFIPKSAYPILTYHSYICAHSHIEMSEEEYRKGICAMWREGELLACAFRLCNFRRARLAPRKSFEALVAAIVRFLAGENVTVDFQTPVCNYERKTVRHTADVMQAVQRGMDWFFNAQMLVDNGRGGVREGLSHLISAKDGVQKRTSLAVRADCTGEVAGALMLSGILSNDDKTRLIGEEMFDFVFDYLQVKDGEHRGMLRWTETAWETCYQDDVARAVLAPLLRQHFDGTVPHFDDICAALDFLVSTTSPEGVRVARTDLSTINAKREKIMSPGGGLPSAHYNAYYHAVLLLAYRAGGDKRYLEVAERGLGHLMSLYPETRREQSETEENCRLLFPLAVLYEITGKKEHYEWLCRVMSFLDEHRDACGAVPEWDTGHKAACARNHTGECALLANNGDPVVDLLYSNNWLPLGYAYAYLATGEKRFYEAWCEIASFLLSCQIHSEDKLLDGAWTRAFDLENWESNGVPHDVGWAPCCVETGWTMGEILMGLQFMRQVEKTK